MDTAARTAETTRTTCPFANLLALDPTDSVPSMATSPAGSDTKFWGSRECI